MEISLKMLKSFVEITQEKSISKVADQLYISQPALSLQLKKLEELYGARLLERTMRGVEPTEEGKLLAEYCKKILNLYHQSFEEISNLKKQHQMIHIEANLTLATYVLPVMIYKLQQQNFDHCFFELTFNMEAPVESNILNGLSQIGFVQREKKNSNLIYKKVAEDHLTVVAARDYPIENRIALGDLKNYPMIEVFDKLKERVSLRDTLKTHHVSMEDLNIVMSLHSTESVKTAILGKIGIAMLPYTSVKKELESGEMKEIRVEGLLQKYPVYLVYLKEKQYDNVLNGVVEFLRDQMNRFFEVNYD